jgi:NAD(P)-dependent dehydrogenase (short-subunit alcohol dehydrogenase family)
MSSYNGLCSKGGHNQYTINKKKGRGILVNTLAPGATETALFLKGKSQ